MLLQVIYAVIDDVYTYTVGAVFEYMRERYGVASQGLIEAPRNTLNRSPISEPVSHPEVIALEPEGVSHTQELAPQTFRAVGAVLEKRIVAKDGVHTVGYITSTNAPLFVAPTKEFDTVITKLPYGSMVMVIEEKGRFAHVALDGVTGWVLRDDVVDRAAHVYPEFSVGTSYQYDDPQTHRLRACIGDAFHGGEAEIALQSGEYVAYKLFRKNLTISWPPTRPRIPGRWHTILKGVPGIQIGSVPKTGSVMECRLEHDIGHLAYVESVLPDGHIMISEINYPDGGVYNERTLSQEAWQEMKPVFITVT